MENVKGFVRPVRYLVMGVLALLLADNHVSTGDYVI